MSFSDTLFYETKRDTSFVDSPLLLRCPKHIPKTAKGSLDYLLRMCSCFTFCKLAQIAQSLIDITTNILNLAVAFGMTKLGRKRNSDQFNSPL